MGAVVHRLATLGDAALLFEVRRRAILALAPPVMSIADAEAWAGQVTLARMERKLRELEIWIAEPEGVVAGGAASAATASKRCTRPPNMPGRASVPRYSTGSKD